MQKVANLIESHQLISPDDLLCSSSFNQTLDLLRAFKTIRRPRTLAQHLHLADAADGNFDAYLAEKQECGQQWSRMLDEMDENY